MNSSSVPFNWLLENLELDASLFHIGRYCGSWQASTYGMTKASFHLLLHGSCWLHVDEPKPTSIELRSGDAVFLLRDIAYRLSETPDSDQARQNPRRDMEALTAHTQEGVGLVCGFFQVRPGLSSLVLEALPDCLVLRAEDVVSGSARKLFELVLAECQREAGPSAVLLERLSHLLFLYVLRDHQLTLGALGGLLGLARQPQFSALLEELIAHPEKDWTLEQMAERCGLSRSAFCKRFLALVGRSPGQILLNLRMHQACRLLQRGQAVAEVADACGYQSIAAFTRAFDKVLGLPPGAYRKSFSH